MLDEVVRSGSKSAPFEPFKSPLTCAQPLPPGHGKVRSDEETDNELIDDQRTTDIGTLKELKSASHQPLCLAPYRLPQQEPPTERASETRKNRTGGTGAVLKFWRTEEDSNPRPLDS